MFRRFGWLFLALVLFLSVLLPALANEMQEGSMYVYTANGKSLHLRSSKSTANDKNIIREIPYGAKVYVAGWDATWARVEYFGDSGYVVRKYLRIGPPASYEEDRAQREAAKEEKAAKKALENELRAAQKKLDRSTIKAVTEYDVSVITELEDETVKLYKTSSLLASVLKEYTHGARLTVIAQNNDWAKVYDGADDLTGYILRADLAEDIMEEEMLED